MNHKRIKINYFNSSSTDLNTQNNPNCRCNSLLHRKETANKDYKNRISLSPLGETKMDIRDNIPTYHIRDMILKTNYLNELEEIKAFDKADFQTKINSQIKKQKYQLLLEKDFNINTRCKTKSEEIKVQFENRKKSLREQLITIIRNSLLFAKKNSPVAAMLPIGVNEFFEKLKLEEDNDEDFLNFSTTKTMRRNSERKTSFHKKNEYSRKHKNEFLSLIGVDVENLSMNNINIDIDKAWKFVLKLAKGRNVDEILRYKVVNSIMSLTEQKASEKVKKIYQKLELYKEHKRKERREELKKKREEERKRHEELKKMDPSELIKKKMKESLNKVKTFNKDSATSTLKLKMKKKKNSEKKAVKKEIIKLN